MNPEELQEKVENATKEQLESFGFNVALFEFLKEQLETKESLSAFLSFSILALRQKDGLDIDVFIKNLRDGIAVVDQVKKNQH